MGWEKCLLRIDLSRDEDSRKGEIVAELIGDNGAGSVVFRAATKETTIEICDFPFGDFVLRLRQDFCFDLHVFGISNHYPFEEQRRIYLPKYAGYGASTFITATGSCPMAFRVSDADSAIPVPGASIELEGGSSLKTDRYGRILLALPWRKKVPISVSAEGYRLQVEEVTCPSDGKGLAQHQSNVSLYKR